MSDPARALPHRLAPDAAGGGGLFVAALVCFFMAGLIYYGIAQRPGETPDELWLGFGFALLFGVGVVVVMLRRAARRWSGRVPVIEVDAPAWRPGEAHQLRIVVPDLASLVELDVSLEALSWERAQSSRNRRHQVPVHTTRLLNLSGDELEAARAAGGVDRTLSLSVPAEFAMNQWLWGIHVRGTKNPLTEFQKKMLDTLLAAQLPGHLQGAQKDLVLSQVRAHVPKGTQSWDVWFRVEVG